MKISLIVAMTKSRVIGCDNQLPWHIPEDLKRFKKLTMGNPIVMGRKTYDSIGRPLPGRLNIVITRNTELKIPGVSVVSSFNEAIVLAKKEIGNESQKEIFILGGGQIFQEALPVADKLYVTWVHKDVPGDVLFPKFDEKQFNAVEDGASELTAPIPYSYVNYERLSL